MNKPEKIYWCGKIRKICDDDVVFRFAELYLYDDGDLDEYDYDEVSLYLRRKEIDTIFLYSHDSFENFSPWYEFDQKSPKALTPINVFKKRKKG